MRTTRPGPRSGRHRLAVAGAVAALTALVATGGISEPTGSTADQAEVPAASPAVVGGASAACDEDQIEIEVAQLDGGTLCSHGPDPAGTPAAPPGGVAPESTAGIQCYGDGTSGPRVQFIYVHTSSVNRFSTLKPKIVARAAQIDVIFDGSAGQTGGDRHVRFVTDTACNVDVDSVTVSSSAITPSGFGTLTNELVAKGYNDPDRKYLIWADTNNAVPNLCYGLATVWNDDRPGTENYNNTRTGYGRVDDTCLNAGFYGQVEAHELMHTLGAVQGTSPHATDYGHCTDDYDRMCYDDDGSGGKSVSLVCSSTNELRFDCRNDDYFYASAPCGSSGYLASHWNTADTRWLARAPAATGSPPANDPLSGAANLPDYAGAVDASNASATSATGEPAHAGTPGGASLWYRWTAPVTGDVGFDTCGSDADTLLAVYTGSTSSYTALQPVASNDDNAGLAPQSLLEFPAVKGVTYLIAVDGKSGDRGDLTLRWGAPQSGFTDVALGSWYEPAVNWAKLNELLSWLSGTTFNPKNAANRGQVVQMLWTMVDRPTGSPPHGFSDVPSTAFYDDALDWAKANGLVTGFPGNLYKPSDPVNRGQIVNMLWNMVGRPGGSPQHGFSDVSATAFYDDALDWAKAEGLVTGFPGNQYKPKDPVNRAQFSNMLFGLAANPDAWTAYGSSAPTTTVF